MSQISSALGVVVVRVISGNSWGTSNWNSDPILCADFEAPLVTPSVQELLGELLFLNFT